MRLDIIVQRVVFHNDENGWTVLRFRQKTHKYDEFAAVGLLAKRPIAGDELVLIGSFIENPKYGTEFKIEGAERPIPATDQAITDFISNNVKGVGVKTAGKILAAFGTETYKILESDIDRVRTVKGVSKKQFEKLKDFMQTYLAESPEAVVMKLTALGVPYSLSIKIEKELGSKAVSIMQENPYILIENIDGIGFKRADEVALRIGFKKDSYERIAAGLIYTMKQLAKDGHCYATRQQLLEKAIGILELKAEPVQNAIRRVEDQKGLVFENGRVYLPYLYKAEKSAASDIARLCGSTLPVPSYDRIRRYVGDSYDDTQLKAIQQACSNSLFILTGGPGTGKTYTVQGIIKYFKSRDPFCRILLAAPTGKAAKRMEQVTRYEACTIHRLLEYTMTGPKRTRYSPLEGDVLIVDESSMIDIELLSKLLDAVPDHMQVIFVGDSHQLPSVGPGNCLADMIGSGVIPCVELKFLHRQDKDSYIAINADHINKGEPIIYDNYSPGSEFNYQALSDEQIADRIVGLYMRKIEGLKGHQLDEAMNNMQVLLPSKRGTFGTRAINERLQNLIHPREKGEFVSVKDYDEETDLEISCEFRVGDRVMQTVNDYDNDVFNGDSGIVVWTDNQNKEMVVQFDDGGPQVKYTKKMFSDIMLSYAITIHKSQGSEYPTVITALSRSNFIMLTRKLFYTCVTRAKKKIIVLDNDGMARAITNDRDTKRNTALGERVAWESGRVKLPLKTST